MTPIHFRRFAIVLRHDIANIPTFAAKTYEVLLWRHEIHDVFRIWAYVVQNLIFCHDSTMNIYIFSLKLTGDFDSLNSIY